jgi:predicted metalloprotease
MRAPEKRSPNLSLAIRGVKIYRFCGLRRLFRQFRLLAMLALRPYIARLAALIAAVAASCRRGDFSMRWQGGRRSENVEDRRGMQMSMGRRPMTCGGGCLTLIILLLALYFGGPQLALQILGGGGGGPVVVEQGEPQPRSPEEDQLADFVSVVLADTEDVWAELFQTQRLGVYDPPKIVYFTQAVDTGCGFADARVGPFYCPRDRKIYIDLSFFQELNEKFGAPGDFAQAYVIAHEVGHHVQNLLGISDDVHARQQGAGEVAANDLSVRLELQADFLAGVWAHHAHKARNIIEGGDIEEALDAASAIGDDRLQQRARGHVNPDSFTHGSSAQRVKWFKLGLATGDFDQGDTFNVPNP